MNEAEDPMNAKPLVMYPLSHSLRNYFHSSSEVERKKYIESLFISHRRYFFFLVYRNRSRWFLIRTLLWGFQKPCIQTLVNTITFSKRPRTLESEIVVSKAKTGKLLVV